MDRKVSTSSRSFGADEQSFVKLTSAAVLSLGVLWLSALPTFGQAPTLTVNGPTQITSSNAIIAVTINPNGLFTSFYVQWGSTAAYGQTSPVGVLPIPNAVTNTSAWMIGLSPSATYHYRVVVANSAGTNYSPDATLATTAGPPPPNPQSPTATTGAALVITTSNATLGGTVGKDFTTAAYYFRWGLTDAYGNNTTPGLLSDTQTAGTFAVFGDLAGLSPGTTYHYQLVATNSVGVAGGADRTFTTLGLVSIGGNTFTYSSSNGTVTILGYSGPGGQVNIPATIAGLPVTCIGREVFSYLDSLTGVTIPDGVTYIGFSAFMGCTGLTNICIPGSVKVIADSVFASCTNLANVTLGEGVAQIGGDGLGMGGTFAWCYSLARITIPDSVTNIVTSTAGRGGPIGTFAACDGLTNVVVGKGLQFLGTGTFRWCSNLIGVFFRGNAPTPGMSSFGDFIFNGTDLATLYYLPGTTGWEPTYAGRPTVLWNPLARTGSVQQGHFGFNITGTAGIPIVIEASSDPATGSWIPLQECTLTNGLIHFSDASGTHHSSCIYRIRSP